MRVSNVDWVEMLEKSRCNSCLQHFAIVFSMTKYLATRDDPAQNHFARCQCRQATVKAGQRRARPQRMWQRECLHLVACKPTTSEGQLKALTADGSDRWSFRFSSGPCIARLRIQMHHIDAQMHITPPIKSSRANEQAIDQGEEPSLLCR